MTLVGNVYTTVRSDQSVRQIVVLREQGTSITVDNVEPPHKARRVRRDRLEDPHQYRLIGHVKEDGPEVVPLSDAPKFDGPAFADWLVRFMEAEHLTVAQLAERSGVSASLISTFRKGEPTGPAKTRGQKTLSPSLTAIAGIAHGLGMQFSYVASKAGIDPEAGDRWSNFTDIERLALAIALDSNHTGEDVKLDDLLEAFIAPPQTKEKV